MDNKQWLMKLATIKNTTTNIPTLSIRATVASNSSLDLDVISGTEDGNISSVTLLTLIILYGIVVFSGIIGNVTLLVTLCSQSSSRLRNPLLLALCLADLLVTGVAAPLTIIALILKQSKNSSWSLMNASCKAFHYMQSISIAASTLCFLMLSFHRYATVKHPRLAQLSQRQLLPSLLASGAWLSAAALCVPILLAYKVTISSNISSSLLPASSVFTTTKSPLGSVLLQRNNNLYSDYNNSQQIQKVCTADYGSEELHALFIVGYTLLVFVIPTTGVILNHLGVRKKLCALSLTARAAHGELPLPMPTILRRPTHMIIVTGMANNAINVNNESSDEEYSNLRINRKNNSASSGITSVNRNISSNRRFNGHRGGCSNGASSRANISRGTTRNETGNGNHEEHLNLMAETRFRASPRTPRSIRLAQNQQVKKIEQPAPELPLPQTSTLRSRRKLANILVAAGIIFAACWAPHFFCLVCREFGYTNGCTKSASDFFLLLGFAHSAVSPLLHWALNYNSLRQSTCAPFARLNTAQRVLRSHLRFRTPPPPPSSTNEAALGPFNPRYIKARPQQVYRPPASSHYLY